MSTNTFFADTLIVSDIHCDWRYSRSDACCKLIRSFRGKRLVLLGDVFHYPKHLGVNFRASRFLGTLIDTARSGIETVLVIGNHDPAREYMTAVLPDINVCDEWSWQSGSKRFYARHGHKFNGYNRHVWKLGEMVMEIPDNVYHSIQRHECRGHRLSRFLRRNVGKILKLNDALVRGMSDHVEKHGINADVLLCGHTHEAELRDLGGKLFCNPGSWVGYDDELITYAVIDEEGKIRIERYRD